MQWTAIVPVKRLAVAKTRLHVPGVAREDLALAFALDTVTALVSADAVERVVVITNDDRARAAFAAQAIPAITTIPDAPDAGLNAALRHGADVARRDHAAAHLVAVSADLPALTGPDVDAVLKAADEVNGSWFLGDISGIGTTMLGAPAGVALAPAFGARSRAAHARAGAREVITDARSARRDVDTAVDLWDARRLGLGPNATALLQLGDARSRADV